MKGASLRGLGAAVAAIAITASLAGCDRMSGTTASLSTLAPVMARADGDPAGFEVDQVPHPVPIPLSSPVPHVRALVMNDAAATLVAMDGAHRPQRSQ